MRDDMTTNAYTCWLIEDNPADADLFKLSLEGEEGISEIRWFDDANKALEALGRDEVPSLIVLDLNLPGCSGHEFLERFKNSELRGVPVVVWTSSRAPEDISRSYDLHANCCLHKPLDFPQMATLAQTFRDFWVRTAVLC
jgi:CheY-like chemotaxis protein